MKYRSKEKMMNRKELLEEAGRTIAGQRQDDYGDARQSFDRIAALWSAYTGSRITAADVASMMVLLKASRARTSPEKIDSWLDMAGYAALAAEMVSDG